MVDNTGLSRRVVRVRIPLSPPGTAPWRNLESISERTGLLNRVLRVRVPSEPLGKTL